MRKLLTVLSTVAILAAAAATAAFYWLPLPACELGVYTEPADFLIAPDGQYAYLSDRIAPRLLVFSLADNRLAANLPLPAAAGDMALSRDGANAYLLSAKADGTVFVVNTASRKVERNIELGGKPTGLAVSADGSRLFTVQSATQRLVALDSSTGKPVANTPFQCTACSMMLTADGKSLVVGQAHGIAVFDAKNLAVSMKQESNEQLTHFALSPDGKTIAYSFAGHNPGVRFLDLAGGGVETRATMGQVGELAFSADGASVIASDVKMPLEERGSLSFMPAHIPQEVKGAIVPSVPPDRSTTFTLDKFPHAIAIDARRDRIDVVAMPDKGLPMLEVLDGATRRMVAQMPVPDAKTRWDEFAAWRNKMLRPNASNCRPPL
ncbi:MAG TPA: PQQ-binding-like beta-propeller repeat protein [Burkholderiaceae bacterium]